MATRRGGNRRRGRSADKSGGGGWWLVVLIVVCGGGYIAWDQLGPEFIPGPPGEGSQVAATQPSPPTGQTDRPAVTQPVPTPGAGSGSETTPPDDPEAGEAPEPELVPVVQRALATIELQRIHGMVVAWRFDEAVRELEQYLSQEAEDKAVRDEAQRRLTTVKGYASLRDALVAAINGGGLRNQRLKLPGMSMRIRLTGADASGMQATYKGATIRERWTTMSPDKRAALFDRVELSPAQLWSRAELAFATGLTAYAERALVALWKLDPDSREEIDDRLAAMRDEMVPMGGYVLHEDRLVSALEKEQLSKGLVQHEGKWVTPDDREHLLKGHIQVDGTWRKATARQLKARGYVRFKGRWYSQAGYRQLRTGWAHAWELEGTYWRVRNNTSEAYAKSMLSTLDQLYTACNAFYKTHLGNLPPTKDDGLLGAYLFAGHEAYARYLKSIGRHGDAGVPGITRPKNRMIAVWHWIDDEGTFRRTVTNRAARICWRERFPEPPYWIDRGLAAYFEGFSSDRKGTLQFHGKPRHRLSKLLSAIRKKTVLPIDELVAVEKDELADDEARRRIVHAQSWGLIYFLTRVDDKRLRGGFDRYLQAIAAGKSANLLSLLGVDGEEAKEDFARRFRNYIRRVKPPTGSWLGGSCKCAIK